MEWSPVHWALAFGAVVLLAGLGGLVWLRSGGPLRDWSRPAPWFMHRPGFAFAVFVEQHLGNLFIPPPLRLGLLSQGMMKGQVLYVVARLRLADAIGDGARTAADLAAELDLDADVLHRVMRSAATMGVFRQLRGRPDTYQNTRVSSSLRSDHPNDMTDLIRAIYEQSYDAWGGLLHATRTGENAFEHRHDGVGFWTHLHADQDQTRMFERAMASADCLGLPSILQDYQWSRYKRVLDIGGSLGTVLSALLRAHPHMTGVLCDLPDIIASAQKHWATEHADLQHRVELVGGSFFDGVPEGQDGDVYVMRVVIHDWPDEEAIQILSNVRAAMGQKDARLVLIEMVIGEPEPVMSRVLTDLHMLVNFSSRERTRAEWASVLEPAGFRISRVQPARSLFSVVEATPVQAP